jgi:hypothetical protein
MAAMYPKWTQVELKTVSGLASSPQHLVVWLGGDAAKSVGTRLKLDWSAFTYEITRTFTTLKDGDTPSNAILAYPQGVA